jgi:alkanesulfonate monooxygenase SsuD/methylene tetrahydromethanopterin reductase-like flavin-dependent oxidoreductase (luciferase family)
MDESVRAMKMLWRHGEGEFAGRFVRFPPLRCEPRPFQADGPRVLLGVPNLPAKLITIAQGYDGWIANGASPRSIASGRELILRECERIGRDSAEIQIVAMGFDLTQEALRAYERAGADMVVGALYNHPGGALSVEQRANLHKAMVYNPTPTPDETLAALAGLAALSGRRPRSAAVR